MDEREEALLSEIENAIYSAGGGRKKFLTELPFIFRQAVDELIDAPRTRRLLYSDLEPHEKTVLGTKIEAALRELLGFNRGKLDFIIGPHDVDVKFSGTGEWMLPPQVLNHVCLVAECDEAKATFSLGIVEITSEKLREKANWDRKLQLSTEGRNHIRWLARKSNYPGNIWVEKTMEDINNIFEPTDGTNRVARLFLSHLGEPIHRSTIQAVARQHDYMKRVRSNQGARDILHPMGIFILSGTQDGPLLRSLGIALGRDYMLAYKAKNPAEAEAIKNSDKKNQRHSKNFNFCD